MWSEQNGILATAKKFLYQSCFCLGVITATYGVFSQVHQWLSPALPQSGNRNLIQDKVQALVSDGSSIGDDLVQKSASPVFVVRNQPLKMTPVVNLQALLPVIAPADAGPLVMASPSATPGEAGGAVAAADASASPTPADGAQASENSESVPLVTMQPYPILGNYQNYGGPVPASVGYNVQQAVGSNDGTATASANPAIANDPGMMGGNLDPSASDSGTNSGYVGSYGSNLSNNGSTGSTLSSQDLTTILGTQLQGLQFNAVVNSQPVSTISGLASTWGSTSSPQSQSNLVFYGNRWSVKEGLDSAVSFSTRSATSGAHVAFLITLQVQDLSGHDSPAVISSTASSVESQQQIIGAKSSKVYTFTLPDTTGTYPMKNLQVRLVYQTGPQGAMALVASESRFTFTRSNISGNLQMTNKPWMPGTAATPAASIQNGDAYYFPNELPYSVNLSSI